MPSDIPSKYSLAILGSEATTPKMLTYTQLVVARAKLLDWAILTPDSPTGISAATIDNCDLNKVLLVIFGITIHPRKRSQQYPRRYMQIPREASSTPDSIAYENVDRFLIDQADRILIVWNGAPGDTRILHAYEYAKTLAKPCHFITLDEEAPLPLHPIKPPTCPTTTVELLIDITPPVLNNPYAQAKYALVALDSSGEIIAYHQHMVQGGIHDTPEAVGLQATLAALKQLHSKLLPDHKPTYKLKIYNGNPLLREWLIFQQTPNSTPLQPHIAEARQLLTVFENREWIKVWYAVVRAQMDRLPKIEILTPA